MIYYKIFCYILGEEYRLTTRGGDNRIGWDHGGPWRSFGSYSLWQISFHPGNKWNVGFVMVNKVTGNFAVPDTIRNGELVTEKSIPSDGVIPDKYVWQTNVAEYKNKERHRTIMPLLNNDLCLSSLPAQNFPSAYLKSWKGGNSGADLRMEPVIA